MDKPSRPPLGEHAPPRTTRLRSVGRGFGAFWGPFGPCGKRAVVRMMYAAPSEFGSTQEVVMGLQSPRREFDSPRRLDAVTSVYAGQTGYSGRSGGCPFSPGHPSNALFVHPQPYERCTRESYTGGVSIEKT